MHVLAVRPTTSAIRRLTTGTCSVITSLKEALLLSLPTAMARSYQ